MYRKFFVTVLDRRLERAVDAHAAAEKLDGLRLLQSQFAHPLRQAPLGRIVFEGFQNVGISPPIAAEDPAVKAGMFTAEVAPFLAPEGWFGKWAPFGKFEKVFFGFLVTGSNRGQDAETAKQLQADHLAYMEGQANEGKLVLAGPFTTDGTRRGIVVYRVADEAEARRRGEGDPMIKAGRLALELHPWQVPIGALPVTGK